MPRPHIQRGPPQGWQEPVLRALRCSDGQRGVQRCWMTPVGERHMAGGGMGKAGEGRGGQCCCRVAARALQCAFPEIRL